MRSPLLMLLCVVGGALSAKILGINPTGLRSHQQPLMALMAELAQRGHQVTVITARPMEDPPKNMRQIDMSFTYPESLVDGDHLMTFAKASPHEKMEMQLPFHEKLCDIHFKFPEIKQLLRSHEKFDVVVMELFTQWCYFGYIKELGSPPVVGFVSLGISPEIHGLMGSPYNPAYMSDYNTPYTDYMSFWERFHNTYTVLRLLYSFHNVVVPFHDAVIQKHFGPTAPSLSHAAYNISLLLSANHYVTNYPRPTVPSIVEVTGLHIRKNRKPLPEKIGRFLEGSEHGFIYVNLGPLVRSSLLPDGALRALLQAFSALPQRVLWKYDGAPLPWAPDNLMTAYGLPQQDILAHPRIRLFVTQGDLHSFSEAAYFGVPLVGVPALAEQPHVVSKAVSEGLGVRLHLEEMSNHYIVSAVREVLGNASYAENMRRFSALYREHQTSSAERAVWWLEYVVRHRGAPHLRSAALDLRWWQLLLLDVLLALATAAALLMLLIYKLLQPLLSTKWLSKKLKIS